MTAEKVKCKHDSGWLSIGHVNIYIYSSGKVEIGYGGRNKVRMICNSRTLKCLASRNVYLFAKVKKWGKIKKLKYGEYKYDR